MSRVLARNFGTSLKFNGSSTQYVTVKNGSLLGGLTNITISAWVRPFSPGNDPIYSERATTGQDILKFQLYAKNAGGVIAFTYRDDEGHLTDTAPTNVVTYQMNKYVWNHVAVVRNGTGLTMYLNGVAVGTANVTTGTSTNFTNSVQCRIGGDNGDSSANFEGNINEVATWSRSLSATEIAQVYTNGAPTVTGSLQGLWLLNEATGTTANDTSGNNNTGTITGATWSTDVPSRARQVVRDFGGSLYFNGASSVSTPAFVDGVSQFSAAMWLKRAKGNVGSTLLRAAGFTDRAVGFTGNNFSFCLALGSGNANLVGNFQPIDNVWYHVACTYDGATMKIYVNGTLDSAIAATGSLVNTGAWGIGGSYTGYIDKVDVWNRGLSQSEVQALYNPGIIPSSGLVANYPLNEATGTTATDTSGNNNTGTISGATWSTDVPMRARHGVVDYKASIGFTGTNLVSIPRTVTQETSSITWGARVRLNTISGNQTIIRKWSSSGAMVRIVSGKAGVQVANGATRIQLGNTTLQAGVWYHVAGSYNAVTGVLNVYLNGVLDGSSTVTAGNIVYDTTATVLGNEGGGTEPLNGKMVDGRMFGSALSAADIQSWYMNGSTSATPIAQYPLQEGAGTTAYDTSGNGNNGTITGATFTADVPTKKRQIVGGNMISNGAFDYIPPTNTATTIGGRWIDGTAAGSTSNKLFGWGFNEQGGSSYAQFDTTNVYSGTASLKLATTATSSYAGVYLFAASAATDKANLIPVSPSTSYTCTFRMMTTYTSGSASAGAYLACVEFAGSAGGVIAETDSTGVQTTTGWTQYSITFTTSATTQFISPSPRVYGHTGAGTLIMTANFDDIVLVKTTPTTRQIA